MMTAVMMDARRPGRSGWTHCRGLQRVRVSGIRGGRLEIKMKLSHEEGEIQEMIREDQITTMPSGVDQVQVVLHECTSETRLFVDLLPKE